MANRPSDHLVCTEKVSRPTSQARQNGRCRESVPLALLLAALLLMVAQDTTKPTVESQQLLMPSHLQPRYLRHLVLATTAAQRALPHCVLVVVVVVVVALAAAAIDLEMLRHDRLLRSYAETSHTRCSRCKEQPCATSALFEAQ